MKIVAINGSHRPGQNTAELLTLVLKETEKLGCSSELIELSDLNINFCKVCHSCLKKTQCSIRDDMAFVEEKLLAADGILLGSPVYWINVSALMKNFMDRTRYLHISKSRLAGKVGAAVTVAGLLHGGQESTLQIMENFLYHHGLYIVDGRDHDSEVLSIGITASLMTGYQEQRKTWRRHVAEDELIRASCQQMGRNMVDLIRRLH